MKELIKNLHVDELEELQEILIKTIGIKGNDIQSNHLIIERQNAVLKVCSKCGSNKLLKNGKTKNGVQKYICKHCKKTCCNTTGKVIHYSKYPYSIWKGFVECTLLQMSLQKTAEKLNISKTTAFYWRHKIFKAISKYVKKEKLNGLVQSDATYVDINLKGTKPINMPRKSKKRPKSNYYGLSREKVCIVSAVDENDNMIFEIAGLGRESIEHYQKLKPYLENVKTLITDQAWGYTTFSAQINCKLEQVPHTCYSTTTGYNLSELNELHSKLKSFLKIYNGVSLRHLQGYLDLYVLIRKHNYKFKYNENIKKTFQVTICANEKLFNRQICRKILPVDLSFAFSH